MNQVIRKKMLCTLFFALFSLAGCGLSNGQKKDVQAIDTDFFNYPPYEDVWGISFMEAKNHFVTTKRLVPAAALCGIPSKLSQLLLGLFGLSSSTKKI